MDEIQFCFLQFSGDLGNNMPATTLVPATRLRGQQTASQQQNFWCHASRMKQQQHTMLRHFPQMGKTQPRPIQSWSFPDSRIDVVSAPLWE